MDSKLRCVFEMPNENDKLVSKSKTPVYTGCWDRTEICSECFSVWFVDEMDYRDLY